MPLIRQYIVQEYNNKEKSLKKKFKTDSYTSSLLIQYSELNIHSPSDESDINCETFSNFLLSIILLTFTIVMQWMTALDFIKNLDHISTNSNYPFKINFSPCFTLYLNFK